MTPADSAPAAKMGPNCMEFAAAVGISLAPPRLIAGSTGREESVFSDVVQIGFFLFRIASIIQDRPDQVGLAVT